MHSSRKKSQMSLRLKSSIMVIAALSISAALFFAIYLVGDWAVDKYYLTEEKGVAREKSYASEFDEYVKDNKIASYGHLSIREWCAKKGCIYLEVLTANGKIYATDGTFDDVHNKSDDDTFEEESAYTAHFSDGTAKFSLTEYSQQIIYNYILVGAIAAAVALFLILILAFMHMVVKRITVLSKEVREVCSGNLERDIVVSGKDEIGMLGNYTNDMRKSIISHYENERKALQANNELIAAISHDIRTPLTAIMGYSEIMSDDSNEDYDEIKQCAVNCKNKAYQLKEMTDTLFKYFFVYGNSKPEIHLETYSATLLLQQLLGEHIVYFQQQGYIVNTDKAEVIAEDFNIDTDVTLVRRVFDNVFSNVEKYADKNKEIVITISPKPDKNNKVHIKVLNYISKEKPTAASTKIGVKTSEKIMEELGGEFKFVSNKNRYTAEVIFKLGI